MERLQHYLARAGVASRRAAERLILEGKVSVNGQLVTVMGVRVDPALDRVMVGGRPIGAPAELAYIMLHKPVGYVTTMRDPQGRRRIADLLPSGGTRVFPVGRLDRDTSGLLLMTNDGGLAHKLLHPSRGVWKTYRATVTGVPRAESLGRLRGGIDLDDGRTAPAKVKILAAQDGYATVEIKLHEGRKRQIRRMFAALGHPVRALTRVGFGPLVLGSLACGDWRPLTQCELDELRRAAGEGAPQRVGEPRSGNQD